VASLGRRPGGVRNAAERDRAPRQFIFGDGAGGVERIRIDFSGPHLEHLREGLDTTPDALRHNDGDVVEVSAPLEERLTYNERNHTDDYDDELAADLEVGLVDDDELVESTHGEGGNRRPGREGAA
jgi:hypothetical protein